MVNSRSPHHNETPPSTVTSRANTTEPKPRFGAPEGTGVVATVGVVVAGSSVGETVGNFVVVVGAIVIVGILVGAFVGEVVGVLVGVSVLLLPVGSMVIKVSSPKFPSITVSNTPSR